MREEMQNSTVELLLFLRSLRWHARGSGGRADLAPSGPNRARACFQSAPTRKTDTSSALAVAPENSKARGKVLMELATALPQLSG